MSAGVAEAIQKIALVVLGWVLGAAFTPPVKHWWDDQFHRRDAARFFRRNLELARDYMGGFEGHLDRSRGLLSTSGPGMLRDLIEKLTAVLDEIVGAKTQLLALQDDDFEKELMRIVDMVVRYRDGAEKFARPFYRENMRPELSIDAYTPLQVDKMRDDAKTHAHTCGVLIERVRTFEALIRAEKPRRK